MVIDLIVWVDVIIRLWVMRRVTIQHVIRVMVPIAALKWPSRKHLIFLAVFWAVGLVVGAGTERLPLLRHLDPLFLDLDPLIPSTGCMVPFMTVLFLHLHMFLFFLFVLREPVLFVFLMPSHPSHMTQNVIRCVLQRYPLRRLTISVDIHIRMIKGLCLLLLLSRLLVFRQLFGLWLLDQDHSMHPEHWAFFRASRKELLTLNGTSDYVTNQRVLFGQLSREVHFLPTSERKSAMTLSCYHLYRFLKDKRGKPKSDPIVFPFTKYIIPSIANTLYYTLILYLLSGSM